MFPALMTVLLLWQNQFAISLPCPGITSCNSIICDICFDAGLYSPTNSDPDVTTDKINEDVME